MSKQKEVVNEDEEILYFDTLYNFAQVAISANDMALDGYSIKKIAQKLQKSAEAFYLLCKPDEVKPRKKPKKKEPERVIEKMQQMPEPEPLPENFARDENGWLLCPVWNIENKEIAYTRYVNNKHFIDRKDIRNSGMQRTGVSEFIRTHTSATERVAINL